ncbi:GNAT family N-acetyltransferase [Corynebacterium jeikeium]|uniref:GNAT family N-acetyltransferase n=1 Tax=Corynebacterium jeikeium TaxID=38289 RepID=UPI0001B71AFD|nr:GNAT family N-acetyltransferase [Corynebacterium jeikeium]EEW17320.1 acetyltransferase, GNAT family [Corynebacterium jeikeium ATCC 43734]OOD30816.1 N-acetyltransferase [Corynebacterium jeikeium]WCZ54067.1 N-acyltransferase YncA [Corynebacterium jeikeium]SQI20407.1 acetyltransferase [Corynebacterium jeikeium]SUY80627.1 acetyltransferase [Corynebacterium jeikeium]
MTSANTAGNTANTGNSVNTAGSAADSNAGNNAQNSAKQAISIRLMEEKDYPQVQKILQTGMDTGEATFEENAPEAWEDFMRHRLPELSFVAIDTDPAAAAAAGLGEDGEKILGWITATSASHRDVFDGVLEDSIYVHKDAAGKGVAGSLLDRLLKDAAEQGHWAMHSSIFPENEGSVRLHVSRGFEEVGVFHCMSHMNYGPKKGTWRHNMVMEKILEGGPAWKYYQENLERSDEGNAEGSAEETK